MNSVALLGKIFAVFLKMLATSIGALAIIPVSVAMLGPVWIVLLTILGLLVIGGAYLGGGHLLVFFAAMLSAALADSVNSLLGLFYWVFVRGQPSVLNTPVIMADFKGAGVLFLLVVALFLVLDLVLLRYVGLARPQFHVVTADYVFVVAGFILGLAFVLLPQQ